MRLLLSFLALFISIQGFAQIPVGKFRLNKQQFDSLYMLAYKGATDSETNQNEKLRSPAGACKACFMNIQHRFYGDTLSDKDSTDVAVVKDLTRMDNGLYDAGDVSEQILIVPRKDTIQLTYQKYKKLKNQDSVSSYVTDSVFSLVKYSGGYYVLAVGICSRYHLMHLFLDYSIKGKPKWYLFDNHGLLGSASEKVRSWSTSSEVEDYFLQYIKKATSAYAKSPTLKISRESYGKLWPSYERPLFAEVYFLNPFMD